MAKPGKGLSPFVRLAFWTGGGVILLLVGGYAVGYALAGESLPRHTSIEGVDVGGLSAAAAQEKLRAGLADKVAAPITLAVADKSSQATPADLGLEVDYAASIQQAGGGRSFNPLTIAHVLFGGTDLSAVVKVDEAKQKAFLTELAAQTDAKPVDATLVYEGLVPKVTPAVTGVVLDQAATAAALKASFLHQAKVDAVAAVAEPDITTAEAEDAANKIAKPAVAAPIQVKVGDHASITLEPKLLAATLAFDPANGELAPMFNDKQLGAKVAPKLEKVGLKPAQDARFTIKRGGKPTIVASKDGEGFDPAALAAALVPVLGSSDRTVQVAVAPRPAAFTTQDAEAAGVKQVTGQFTTYFPGSAYRYNNIGKAAKLVNGTYLAPGETFSMNAALGERTPQAGWMQGGGIANGKIDPNIYGGGISQATTTTFNAIFFAGLKDIYHKPHSLYFNRYPVGREATLDWRSVDMKFKNDSKYGVLLQAWTTGHIGSQGSVTVKVWSTPTYQIKATKAVRSNYRAPGPTVYDKSDKCIPQGAMSGFDTLLYRQFYQDGKLVKKEPFRWSYNSLTPVVCGKKPGK